MNHMSEFNYNEHEIERAITFLANSLAESSHNSKPVLLHSIRVASILWNNGIPQKYVIAAVLHDIIEDTDISKTDVAKQFGIDVANMVDILTLTKKNDIKQSFENSLSDKNLAAIRAADLIENSNYYSRADTDELRKKLFDKYTYFLKVAKNRMPNSIYDALKESFETNVKSLV